MTVHALEVAYRTHVGLVRQHNEDYLAVLDDLGILVLGDGMGGHQAGEIASKIAVEAAARELIPAQQADLADDLESLLRVGQCVEVANASLFDAVAKEPALKGMGTTLVATLFRDGHVFYAHVGDSRLYRCREGTLRCLTRDHTLVQHLLDQGMFGSRQEIHEAGIGDNVLVRTLGADPGVEVDVGDSRLHPEDIYLLCSDGLTGAVSDDRIKEIVGSGDDDLEGMAELLMQEAFEGGARDNVSFVLARLDS